MNNLRKVLKLISLGPTLSVLWPYILVILGFTAGGFALNKFIKEWAYKKSIPTKKISFENCVKNAQDSQSMEVCYDSISR